jgi:predicted nucleotidyltransferase
MPMCTNLESAKKLSEEKLKQLMEELSVAFTEKEFDKSFLGNICVYACGSLARYELVENSDLDLFFINNSENQISNLNMFNFFSRIYKVQKELGFKDPSKGGLFLNFTPKKNLLDIGSQMEDCNNSLTARLLLLLESKPIFNAELYDKIIEETVKKYFVDYEEHEQNFVPMFLLNDIFRYWYTLTLNYEFRRDEKDIPNDKCWKRLKLKYARLLTCFSFIACLFEKQITPEKVIKIIKKSPLERLDFVATDNNDLSKIVLDIKTKYNWFISLKGEQPTWWETKANKDSALENADKFHDTVVRTFMNEIYKTNETLRNKLDF